MATVKDCLGKDIRKGQRVLILPTDGFKLPGEVEEVSSVIQGPNNGGKLIIKVEIPLPPAQGVLALQQVVITDEPLITTVKQ